MAILTRARKLQKFHKRLSICQFLIHSSDRPSENLTVPSCRNPPAWKRLISDTLSADERVHLIKFIFSDRDEVVVFEYLSRADAQAFVDIVDEASVHIFLSPKNRTAESR